MTCPQRLRHSLACTARQRPTARRRRLRVRTGKGKRVPWRAERVQQEAFIPKDIKDQACQTVYSLSMNQFNRDFDKYSTTFKLAQARSRVADDSILVDALQCRVTNQLAVMMPAIALPNRQEKTGWKWEQWLNKAGEFY